MNRTGEIEVKFDHQLLGKGARVFSHTDTSGEERHRTRESRWKKKSLDTEKNWSEIKHM